MSLARISKYFSTAGLVGTRGIMAWREKEKGPSNVNKYSSGKVPFRSRLGKTVGSFGHCFWAYISSHHTISSFRIASVNTIVESLRISQILSYLLSIQAITRASQTLLLVKYVVARSVDLLVLCHCPAHSLPSKYMLIPGTFPYKSIS